MLSVGNLKSWEQTHQLETHCAGRVMTIERVVVISSTRFDDGLAVGKNFENDFLLIANIFEFQNCTGTRHRVDRRHEASHLTIALVVLECLLILKVTEAIVAKPFSAMVFVDVEEQCRKIFDPGKVLVPEPSLILLLRT